MELEVASAGDAEGARRVYAYTGGKKFDAALPTVVFLHGALHDHSVWGLPARWFAHHGHSVLAPDLPGHGRSAGPPLASVEALSRWLLALLDAVGAAEAALVGHSMGSLIALETAGLAPARVRRLVLMATAFPMKVAPALLEAAGADDLAAIRRVLAFSHSTLAAKPGSPGPGSWAHGSNLALMRRAQAGQPGGNLFLRDFEACDRYGSALEAAGRVRCPSHFILGRRDQMTPPARAEALARALNAEVTTLDAGHALMLEDPEGVLAGLRAALA